MSGRPDRGPSGRTWREADSTASCRLRDEGRDGRLGIAPLPAAGQVTRVPWVKAERAQAGGTSEGERSMSSSRLWRVLLPLALFRLSPAAAQDRILPRVPSFELPQASPRVHGLVGRLL